MILERDWDTYEISNRQQNVRQVSSISAEGTNSTYGNGCDEIVHQTGHVLHRDQATVG